MAQRTITSVFLSKICAYIGWISQYNILGAVKVFTGLHLTSHDGGHVVGQEQSISLRWEHKSIFMYIQSENISVVSTTNMAVLSRGYVTNQEYVI